MYRKGFTLIELGLVIFFASVLIIFGSSLINIFSSEKLNKNPQKELSFYFRIAREKAFSDGTKYTLEINLEEKTIGLREFIPEIDYSIDSTVRDLTISQARRNLLEIEYEDEEELYEKLKKNNKKKKWIIKKQKIPNTVTKVYSVSNLEIKGPVIYLFFYPNGTSDSVVFEISIKDKKKYIYLPRYISSSKTFYSQNLLEDEVLEENEYLHSLGIYEKKKP